MLNVALEWEGKGNEISMLVDIIMGTLMTVKLDPGHQSDYSIRV